MANRSVVLAGSCVAALALGGCGKRGNPKPPSATEQPEKTPTE